jgi:hypothetical protein
MAGKTKSGAYNRKPGLKKMNKKVKKDTDMSKNDPNPLSWTKKAAAGKGKKG